MTETEAEYHAVSWGNSVWNRLSTWMRTVEVDCVVGGGLGGFVDGLKNIPTKKLATTGIHYNTDGFNLTTARKDETKTFLQLLCNTTVFVFYTQKTDFGWSITLKGPFLILPIMSVTHNYLLYCALKQEHERWTDLTVMSYQFSHRVLNKMTNEPYSLKNSQCHPWRVALSNTGQDSSPIEDYYKAEEQSKSNK